MYFQKPWSNLLALVAFNWLTHSKTYLSSKNYIRADAINLTIMILEWLVMLLLSINLFETLYKKFRPNKFSSIKNRSKPKRFSAIPAKTPVPQENDITSDKSIQQRLDSTLVKNTTPQKCITPATLGSTPSTKRRASTLKNLAQMPLSSSFYGMQDLNKLFKGDTLSQLSPKSPQQLDRPHSYQYSTPIGSSFDSNRPSTPFNVFETPKLPMSSLYNDLGSFRTPLQKHLFTYSLSPYKTARPPSRTAISDSQNSKNQYIHKDFNYFSPEEVYESFNLDQYMPKYIEKSINWFSRHLLQPLSKKVSYVDTIFESNGMSHLTCSNATLASTSNPASETIFPGVQSHNQASTNLLAGIPLSLSQLKAAYPNDDNVNQRICLEKYLNISGYENCRKYIVHRIKTLSATNLLVSYKWNSGGDHPDAKPWNSKFDPTDANILFHLFCTFMNETMAANFNGQSYSFISKYVISLDDKPNSSLPFQIVQVVKKPPHYCLYVKSSYYDAPANYQNLFFTACLMLIIIKTETDFYLETTNLGAKSLGLSVIID